jgi:bis(5'-nucleosyl)-tetraphosphatase (symmetrical)
MEPLKRNTKRARSFLPHASLEFPMSTYAIGDVQGCHDELVALLDRINFDSRRDRLWFTGDLVNRGPRSAQTLRLIMGLESAALVVLGNHDLFLLAHAAGHGKLHKGDTMQEVIDAPDAKSLLGWLARQRLLHAEHGHVLVHAGLLPQWSVNEALSLAREVETTLRAGPEFFAHMRGNKPTQWRDTLEGHDRTRVLINAFTRMRFVKPTGEMEFETKTDVAPRGFLRWDEVPNRQSAQAHIIFGHWASRGLVMQPTLSGLDTGCIWGRTLTAMRLEDRALFSVECLAGTTGYSQ